VNNVAAALTTERVSDTYLSSKRNESARPAKRQRPLPPASLNHAPSPISTILIHIPSLISGSGPFSPSN
jgi:hypothetical protein